MEYIVTTKQQAVLIQLYKFRFGTADLLARSLDLKDGRYIYKRLEVLVGLGYIGKHYDKSYKLEGRPATYHLLPKAIAELKHHFKASGRKAALKTLRNAYKDRQASDEFISRKLAVFAIYNRLHALYGPNLNIWTGDQLNHEDYDYFPSPLPATYATLLPVGSRPRIRCFFILYLDDHTPFFVHVRRLQSYIEYVEEEEWQSATGSKLRGVLIVCESTGLLKRIRKKLAQLADGDETPRFCYTALQSVKDVTAEDDEIWQMIGKPLEVFGLKQI